MKAGSRPQYYRIRRMLQMIREGMASGKLVNFESLDRRELDPGSNPAP
jgi:hypothetical protein